MAITIKPMAINPGDPVTSNLISDIIANLQTVAKGETVSNVSVDATDLNNQLDTKSKKSVAYDTTVVLTSSLTVKKGAAGGSIAKIPFDKTFVGTPHVFIQINTIGQSSPSWLNSQVFPQVESVSSTSATVRFRTNTADNAKVQYTAFIVGQLA
jgi:hypothetical protein